MDFINNYGSSDEEDNSNLENKQTQSTALTVNAAPDTGFDVCYIHVYLYIYKRDEFTKLKTFID